MKVSIGVLVLAALLAACATKGPMCGGIAGIDCPAGYECRITEKHPDAAGSCYLLPDDRCERGGDYCPYEQVCVKVETLPDEKGRCMPYGYAVSFCMQDSDCVRQKDCCDCGEGTWVNRNFYNESACGPSDYYCKCAMQPRVPKCEHSRCTSAPI
jgi:hypothetical protein